MLRYSQFFNVKNDNNYSIGGIFVSFSAINLKNQSV